MLAINRQRTLGVCVRVAESAGERWELDYATGSGIHHSVLRLAESASVQISPAHGLHQRMCRYVQ